MSPYVQLLLQVSANGYQARPELIEYIKNEEAYAEVASLIRYTQEQLDEFYRRSARRLKAWDNLTDEEMIWCDEMWTIAKGTRNAS